jgi:hypothetical protein
MLIWRACKMEGEINHLFDKMNVQVPGFDSWSESFLRWLWFPPALHLQITQLPGVGGPSSKLGRHSHLFLRVLEPDT